MKLHNLKGKILDFAKKDRVITTAEIANEFGICWNTAEKKGKNFLWFLLILILMT